MKAKHVFLFVILTLAVLTTAAVCAAEDISLGFTQDLFMPVFLRYDGVSDDAGIQYTPANSAEETAVLTLSENAQLELFLTAGASGPEVREVKLTSRIRTKPREGEKEAFDHHMTACLRTVAALTGWNAGDEQLQAFLDEIAQMGYAETDTLRGIYEEAEKSSHYLAQFRLTSAAAEYVLPYDPAAYKAFTDTLDVLGAAGKIPSDKVYDVLNADDFSDTWATMGVPHWENLTSAKNAVITAEVSWTSAYELPNTASGGCGFVFREAGEGEYLMVSLRMDGNQYLSGMHNWVPLVYPSAFYALPEISGTHQLTLVLNEEWIEVYLDGEFLNSYYGAAIMTEGGLGFATLAGTNYDYGTRCEFKNVFFTTW